MLVPPPSEYHDPAWTGSVPALANGTPTKVCPPPVLVIDPVLVNEPPPAGEYRKAPPHGQGAGVGERRPVVQLEVPARPGGGAAADQSGPVQVVVVGGHHQRPGLGHRHRPAPGEPALRPVERAGDADGPGPLEAAAQGQVGDAHRGGVEVGRPDDGEGVPDAVTVPVKSVRPWFTYVVPVTL